MVKLKLASDGHKHLELKALRDDDVYFDNHRSADMNGGLEEANVEPTQFANGTDDTFDPFQ